MKNSERILTRVLRELCAEHGVTLQCLAEDWIFRLSRGGAVRFVHGYAFDLNAAAAHGIAHDKAAAASVMHAAGVACLAHRLFLNTDLAAFVPHTGNWAGMLAAFAEWGRDVVVKDNQGTGGRGVTHVRSEVELETAAGALFAKGCSVALSPFIEIQRETRFILLGGRCEAAYIKRRPSVTGDGRRTVLELLGEEAPHVVPHLDRAAVLAEIPAKGAETLLNWRHNLGQGAKLQLIDAERDDPRGLHLAAAAAAALNLSFCSIDIVRTPGAELVLEANSGVMMEAFAHSPGGHELARRIYARAFAMMFAPSMP